MFNILKIKLIFSTSLAQAKRFDTKYKAYEYIKKYQLSNVKIAELTLSVSYVTYTNQDRPMTQKQSNLINKLVTTYGYSYPDHVKTVKDASEWISKTLDDVNRQEDIRVWKVMLCLIRFIDFELLVIIYIHINIRLI